MIFTKIKYTITPGFEILEDWIEHLPTTFGETGQSIFKERNEVKIFNISNYELNVKAFKIPNRINRFAYIYLRGSKAARSFRNANRLLEAGANTPQPVAYIECLNGGLLTDSYYISLNFRNDFNLHSVFWNQVEDKENILQQWVRFTRTYLHQQGIYHLDYSPGNVLVRKVGNTYEFCVIDLNRMKFMPVDFEKGIMNFRQLHADDETIGLIATEYATLSGEPVAKAIELLSKYDKSNKAFRRRKAKLKRWLTGKKE